MGFFDSLFGSKPQTQTTQAVLPAGMENIPQRLGALANTIADRPYTPFPGGSRVAVLNPITRGALEGAAGQDYTQLIRRSATPIRTRSAATPGALRGLMNPYTEAVVDRTLGNIDRQAQIQATADRRRGARQGAFGGARLIIQDSERQDRFERSRADSEAQLRARAFDQAQNQFNTEQNRNVQVGALNRGNDARAVQMLMAQSQARLNPALALQQYDQSVLSDQVARFNEARDYPLQQAGALTSILSGVPRGQSTTTSGGTPGIGSTILGLGSTLVGLGGATGAFGPTGWLTGSGPSSGALSGGGLFTPRVATLANGGAIGYADGGKIDDDEDEGGGSDGPVMTGALQQPVAQSGGALVPRVSALSALGAPLVTADQYRAAMQEARPREVARASAFEGYDNPFLHFGLSLLGGQNIGQAGLGALQALTQKNVMAKREEGLRQQAAMRNAAEIGKLIAARQTAEARAAGTDATVAGQLQGTEFSAQQQALRQAEELRVKQAEGALDRANSRGNALISAQSPLARDLAFFGVTPQAFQALDPARQDALLRQIAMSKGGGTTINLPEGTQAGPIPAGYMLQRGTDGVVSMVAIPGGPAAQKEGQAAKAEENAATAGQQSGSVVFEDIGRLKDLVKNQPWYNPVTGIGGIIAQHLPSSGRANAEALSDTISANIAFDRLQRMREASPTGGALGNVTERELALLKATAGSIKFSQSQDQLLRNLERLEGQYRDILRKFSGYPKNVREQFGFSSPAEPAPSAPTPPASAQPRTLNIPPQRGASPAPAQQPGWSVERVR